MLRCARLGYLESIDRTFTMDQIYAMLSYDHHLDNGLQEPKTRQSRTGLGDWIVRSCSMCDVWNSQSHGDCTCAPKCPSSTTSLSWVRPQIHIQIRLALLGISLYSCKVGWKYYFGAQRFYLQVLISLLAARTPTAFSLMQTSRAS